MYIAIPILAFSKAGGHRVISRLANEWVERGHIVEIILCFRSEPYYPFDKRITITRLNSDSLIDNFKNITRYLRDNWEKYDAIIANQNRTSFYVFWAGMPNHSFKNVYYYIQAYEPDFYKIGIREGHANFFKVHAWLSYFLPFTRIVNSEIYCRYKNIRANRVVYPGLDTNTYYSKDISKFNSTLKIGTIGRKEEWKGTSDVCKAIEILHSNGIKFEYYIAFNDFETVEHNFVKPDGDESLAAFYREMDIVVAACKGQHGGIHYPIIEAMSVGSTVVCTDYYPASESNAYVVDDSSPEQIAKAIMDVNEDRELAVTKRYQALKDIKQFNWSIVSEKFLGYIQVGRSGLK